ncbi:MAG TPA: hypothetical protein VK549_10880, partial [Acidimicrobiia bacterium]|nr:hypothetical protein [Acidimicrobiia bacterium]
RFADAAEMRAALDATPSTSTVPAPHTVPLRAATRETAVLPAPEAPARSLPRRRDLRRPLIAAAAVLLLVAAAIGLIVAAGDDGPAPAPVTTQVTTPVQGTTDLPAPLARALEDLERAARP